MDIFELAATLTLDKSEYDAGLDDAEKSGSGLGDKLKGAFGTAAKAGAGLAAGAGAAGAALYGMATKSAGASDRIDKMSQKIGISREAYQELDFICSQSGADVDKLRVGMKTMTTQMGKAAEGTADSAEMFDKLGLSIYDSHGNLKDQESMLWETLDALQGVENQTERAALAQQLFGKTGGDLMPLINGARGSIEDMRDEAHELGLVLGDETIDAGVNFTDTIDKVTRSFDAVMIKIGAEVMPIIEELLEWVLAHMPEIQGVMETVFGAISGFVTTAMDVVKEIWPVLEDLLAFITDVFAGDWESAWNDIVSAFTKLWDLISEHAKQIFDDIVDIMMSIDWAALGQTIVNLISTAFSMLITALQSVFVMAWNAAKNIDWAGLGHTILNLIVKALGAIVSFLENVFLMAWDAIKNIDWLGLGAKMLDLIISAFGDVVSFLSGLFLDAWDAIKNIDWVSLGIAIWDFIKDAFGSVVTWFKDKFEAVKEKIKNIDWAGLGESIKNFITDAFSNIVKWFEDKFEAIKTKLKEINWKEVGESILDFITKPFDTVAELFRNLFEDGWKSVDWLGLGSDVWETIKGAFTGVFDFFAGIFDFSNIHIKLPHFHIDWEDFGVISVPIVSFEWRAKAYDYPYLLKEDTVLGNNGFGDRGAHGGGELVYSHDRLMQDIRSASGDGSWNVVFNITQEPGEDSEALAQRVSEIMNDTYDRRRAVSA